MPGDLADPRLTISVGLGQCKSIYAIVCPLGTNARHVRKTGKSREKLSTGCNVMAKGFRFMPLRLVRLRTFRLRTWVRLCLSSLCRNLELKVNKKVSYLNQKSLRVFRNFEIPMFYRYEHYMSILHMAIFVYIFIVQGNCGRYWNSIILRNVTYII